MGMITNRTLFTTAGAVFVALTIVTGLASGWGGSSQGSYSDSGLALNMSYDDCAKCHIASNNVVRHHNLLSNTTKQCLDCHKMVADSVGNFTVQVVRDCQVCHSLAVHNTVQHTVVTCGRCHGSDIVSIHLSWRSSSTSTLTACYLCHTSINDIVKSAIAKGVSGQTVYCQDCHGDNPHSSGGGSRGR